jgi:hypothetical protein
MQRILIDEYWIDVPDEYLIQEREYCQEELTSFEEAVRQASTNTLDDQDANVEQARQDVLDKRVEFWRKWNDTIPNNNN